MGTSDFESKEEVQQNVPVDSRFPLIETGGLQNAASSSNRFKSAVILPELAKNAEDKVRVSQSVFK